MSVWAMPSVRRQPSVQLARWQVYRFVLGDQYGDVLSGWDLAKGCGRLSTPVVAFDPSTATARTHSGRLYVLDAEPGYDDDARYVFEARYGAAVPEGFRLLDAADEYWQLIAGQAHTRLPRQGSRALNVVVGKAEEVFGGADSAALWLMANHPLLGATPAMLLGSKAGRRLLYAELTRIELADSAAPAAGPLPTDIC